MKSIGERIKNRREELQLSQDELAQKLGYKSRSSINKIESGERNLTQRKIKAIADALETTPSYIMGWTESEDTAKHAPLVDRIYEAVQNDEKMAFLNLEECEIVEAYRNLSEESKRQLVLMMAFLKDQENKNQ